MMLSFYVLTSCSLLIFKLIIFWLGRYSFKGSALFLWFFFVGLTATNFIELVGFFYIENPENSLAWLMLYYVFAEISVFSFLLFSLQCSGFLRPMIRNILLLTLLILTIPILIPGYVLDGVESIGYSVTRVKGPYYFLVQFGILIPLIMALTFLIYTLNTASVDKIKQKTRLLLFSSLPVFVSVLIIMLLMHLGFKINASVVLSLMTTIMMLIIVVNERKQLSFSFIDSFSLYKFTSMIPNSHDNRFVNKMISLVSNPSFGLSEGRGLIEEEMIREALMIAQGNKAQAADMLGISRQTLQRRLDKL